MSDDIGQKLADKAELAAKMGVTVDEVEAALVKLSAAGERGAAAGKELREQLRHHDAMINKAMEAPTLILGKHTDMTTPEAKEEFERFKRERIPEIIAQEIKDMETDWLVVGHIIRGKDHFAIPVDYGYNFWFNTVAKCGITISGTAFPKHVVKQILPEDKSDICKRCLRSLGWL